MAMGTVYLVGAGPGDPGLLTVKGKRCLENADAIVYDRLASPRLLSFAKPGVELYYVGKKVDHHTVPQDDIEQLLVHLARRGLNVVRLKGGDPFVFGRGGEEALVLRDAGVPWEVVPGITSAVSVPAYAGIPVTFRNVSPSFHVVTGHRSAQSKEIDWGHYAQLDSTLVILMGVKQLPTIVTGLVNGGKSPDTPIALVRWGTRAQQETLVGTLADIIDKVKLASFKSPAVIVVGDVVRERVKLSWYEHLPLMGRRILIVANATEDAHRMADAVESFGAEALTLSVEQVSTLNAQVMDPVLQDIAKAESPVGLYLRTPMTARFVLERLRALCIDVRKLRHLYLAAANQHVASKLAEFGLYADAVEGSEVFEHAPVSAWWCEGHSEHRHHRVFQPYQTTLSSSRIQVAKEWAQQGVDVLWTASQAHILADALAAHLDADTHAIEADVHDSVSAEAVADDLIDVLWKPGAQKAVGAL